jgi:hypothetical protein
LFALSSHSPAASRCATRAYREGYNLGGAWERRGLMKGLFITLPFALAALSFVPASSLGQAARPSVYIEPEQRHLESDLAESITRKKVPVNVVSDRAQATYVLIVSPVRFETSPTDPFARYDPTQMTDVWVALSERTTNVVVWSDRMSEPTEGWRTEQSLANLIAKHLKKAIKKNPAGPENTEPHSHSIAAEVKSFFSH